MAHEIEQMLYVGETPWHGLGVKLEKAPTTREAIVAAGLDWKVGQKPLFTAEGERVRAFANYRESDGRILGVVGPGSTPLQNDEAFKFFDPFVQSGEAAIETAGSLRDGERIWALAKIARDPSIIVPGDEVEKYLLLSNSHDGKVAVRVGFTPIRVVCANTLAAAHADGSSSLLRIFHHKRVAEAVEKASEIINIADQTFEATAKQYRFLAARGVSSKDLETYVRRVFTARPKFDEHGELELGQAKLILPKVVEMFENGRGNTMRGVRGTYWAAYNAVTEYLAYGRGKDAGIRLDNLWFGSSANTNAKALDIAVEMAAAA